MFLYRAKKRTNEAVRGIETFASVRGSAELLKRIILDAVSFTEPKFGVSWM